MKVMIKLHPVVASITSLHMWMPLLTRYWRIWISSALVFCTGSF